MNPLTSSIGRKRFRQDAERLMGTLLLVELRSGRSGDIDVVAIQRTIASGLCEDAGASEICVPGSGRLPVSRIPPLYRGRLMP